MRRWRMILFRYVVAAFRFLLLFYIYIFEWTKLRAFMLIYTNTYVPIYAAAFIASSIGLLTRRI